MGTIYVGRYKVIEELGRGGMGVVYRGEDPVLERQVAIKVLPPKKMNSKSIERFMREAKTAARLDSPYIVKIHDIGQVDDIHFIVMEYVEGHSLSDMIEYEEVPSSDQTLERLKIFRQVLEAVGYAHENGVIHRDLKPDNIMINKSGNVKVMDFGLAFFAGQHSLTEVGQVMGTAAYVSPEQAVGKVTDQRTDIYSLGVILFELLTGRWPFDASNPLEMFRKVAEMPAPSPKSFNKDLSPVLETLVLRSLRKKPEERFQSVAEMIESLDVYLNREAYSQPPSRGYASASSYSGSAQVRIPVSSKMLNSQSMLGRSDISDAESWGSSSQAPSLSVPKRLPAPMPSVKRSLANTAESASSPVIPKPVRPSASSGSSSSIVVGGESAYRRKSAGVVTIGGEAAFRTSMADYRASQPSEESSDSVPAVRPSLPAPGPALRRAIEQTSVDAKPAAVQIPVPEIKPAAVQIPVPKIEPEVSREADPEPKPQEAAEVKPSPFAYAGEPKDTSKSASDSIAHRFLTANAPSVTSGAWMANVDEKEKPPVVSNVDSIDIAALEREPDSIMEAGLAKLNSADYKGAVKEFKDLLERDPSHYKALTSLGLAQLELGEFGQSRNNIELAIKAAPESPEAYSALADFFSRTGQPDLVISALHKALDRDEYNCGLRCRLAFLYLWQNRQDAALEQYSIALEQEPDNFEANWSMGMVLAIQNNIQEALKYLNIAAEANPLNTSACSMLNYLCLQNGQIAMAQQILNRAADSGCRMNAEFYSALADLYIAQKYDNQAVQELGSALKADPGNAEASVKLSSLFCHHGQLGEAVQILDNSLNYHPNSILLHRRLGEVYILGGKMEKALDHFEQLVKLDPSCSESYSRISKISLKKHYDVNALDDYKKAVEAHPVNSAYREDLAMAYYCAGQYEQAIAELVKACRLDYTNPDHPKSLGIMLIELKYYEDAVRQLNASLSMRPGDCQARGMLGRALAGQGLNNLAIIEYQKAIDGDPDMFLFNLPLARAYFMQGRQDQAISCFKRFLSTIPDSSSISVFYNAYIAIGKSLSDSGSYSAASEIFESILQRDPYCSDACNGLAKIWLKRKNYAKASKYVEEASKAAPHDSSLAVTNAEILGAQERWQSAVSVLSKALEIDPHNMKVIEQLGRAYRKCGRLQDAVDMFGRAAEEFPDYAPHFEWLKGRVLYRQGQYEAAVWAYRRSAEADPSDWRVFIDLGKAYTGMQQLDEAAQAYRSAEDAAPAEEKKQIRSLINRLRR